MKRWLWSGFIFLGGLAANVAALNIADRHATSFPSVPDVIVDNLPFVNLFAYGELYLGSYILLFLVVYLRQPWRHFAYLFALIGIFYVGRALFLLTLPIGAPAGAIHAADRLSVYPFGDHSYFPSGHFGLMLVLAFQLQSRRLRRGFLVAATLFGIGTLLTKAHYSADILGGFLIAYAAHAWGERSLKYQWLGPGRPVVAPETQLATARVRANLPSFTEPNTRDVQSAALPTDSRARHEPRLGSRHKESHEA